jgi:hypothetical protein
MAVSSEKDAITAFGLNAMELMKQLGQAGFANQTGCGCKEVVPFKAYR